MTDQQIIETLATKVMGWERRRDFNIVNGSFYKYDEDMDLVDWNPLQNIADAWMIVEKFRNKKDPIMRAEFALRLPVLIYEIKPRDICLAAYKLVA